jgi:hypothetical protein
MARGRVELRGRSSCSPRGATLAALAAVYEASETGRAVKLLTEASSRFEGDAAFQFFLGVACLNANQSELAEAALRKVRSWTRRGGGSHTSERSRSEPAGRGGDRAPRDVRVGTGQNPQNLATTQKLLETLKKR